MDVWLNALPAWLGTIGTLIAFLGGLIVSLYQYYKETHENRTRREANFQLTIEIDGTKTKIEASSVEEVDKEIRKLLDKKVKEKSTTSDDF